MHRRFLLALLLIAAACIHRPAIATLSLPPASAEEYAPFLRPGLATITGQAFLTTRGGYVVKGAGSLVSVDPLTDYSVAWYRRAGRDLKSWGYVPNDSLFLRAHHETTADADGRFRIAGLPPGRYLVRSVVVWDIPRPGMLTPGTEGGVVSAVVEVPASGEVSVILNSMTPAIQ